MPVDGESRQSLARAGTGFQSPLPAGWRATRRRKIRTSWCFFPQDIVRLFGFASGQNSAFPVARGSREAHGIGPGVRAGRHSAQ